MKVKEKWLEQEVQVNNDQPRRYIYAIPSSFMTFYLRCNSILLFLKLTQYEFREEDFLADYPYFDLLTYGYLDSIIFQKYGERNLLRMFAEDDLLLTEAIYNVFVYNAYKYKKLYETLALEYNPIDNYDRTETTERTLEASGGVTANYDKVKTTDSVGATSASTQHGAVTTTTSHGATTTTTNDGVQEIVEIQGETASDTINKKSAMDRNSLATDNESTTTTDEATNTTRMGAKTTTVGTGQYSDSVSTPTYTDTATTQAATNSSQTDAREDVTESENNESEQIETRARGNIGVTTTQQMIEQERSVSDFSFLSVIAHDIIAEIARGVL